MVRSDNRVGVGCTSLRSADPKSGRISRSNGDHRDVLRALRPANRYIGHWRRAAYPGRFNPWQRNPITHCDCDSGPSAAANRRSIGCRCGSARATASWKSRPTT